jgi:hypothetical protein
MRKLFKLHANPAAALLLLLCAVTATSAQAPDAQGMVTVPAGTRLLVRMIDTIDAGRSRAGTLFTARLEANLAVGNLIVAPAGSTIHGRIAQAQGAGRVTRAQLQLELTDILINNTPFPIISSDYSVQGGGGVGMGGAGGRTLRGAGLGTAIGALSGNIGRGAAIGAVAGGATSLVARGEQINLPSGTLLEFRLEQPASLPHPRR